MQHRRPLLLLLPAVLMAACGEDQPPTAPAEAGPLAESHTAGHKVVNSLADPGNGPCNATQCTLREAINDPQSTEITFATGLTGTITLAAPPAGGTLTIDKKLSITGPSTGIVIRRRSTDPDFRIFRIPEAGNVTLTNLTIQNGKRTDRPGAGILNLGTLRLTNSTVAGNTGDGIANLGTLRLTNSTVAGNSVGGISNQRGTVTLTRSTVARNGSVGILNAAGTLTLAGSTVARNTGAGLSNRSVFRTLAVTSLTNVRIVGNSGGGISNFRASATLTNSTVAGNSSLIGGGLANLEGSLAIINSTIAGNSATDEGGGIFSEGTLGHARVTLTNSTVSGNSAPVGGGIFNNSQREFTVFATLTNSTVVSNSASQRGGGIITIGFEAVVSLRNSLVAQNSAPTGPDALTPELAAGEFVASFSLIGDGSGSGITNTDGNQVGSASEPIDPKLGPLADNGGPTQTHRLLLGSPAIDAASTPDCPTTDQRGVLRPQGPACDIGSFERIVQ